MNTQKKTQFMTLTALLTAIAILIPLVMPFKIVIPPASYTLGSHVAIFIAMFLSPWMAIFVIVASSIGFLLAGYPIVIVLRAFLISSLELWELSTFKNILKPWTTRNLP